MRHQKETQQGQQKKGYGQPESNPIGSRQEKSRKTEKKKRICAAIAAGMAFSALAFPLAAPVYGAETYQGLLQEINEKHQLLDAPNSSLQQYQYDFDNGKPMLTEKDSIAFTNMIHPKRTLTKEDARKEIDFLFRLFRTQYGLYTWSGGDAAFEKAEKNILELLDGEGTISIQDYQNYVVKNLSFIHDSHLMFGFHSFAPEVLLYSNEGKQFYKKEGETAFTMDAAGAMPILSVNGEKPEAYLKRAIGLEGEITYFLYAMKPKGERFTVEICYLKDGEEETQTVTLLPAQYIAKPNQGSLPTVVFHTDRGFPYIQVNDMGFYQETGEKDLATFFQFADESKKSGLAVMNLTNNPGGNIQYAHQWFEAYTGEPLQPNYATQRIKPGSIWRSLTFSGQEEWETYQQIMKEMGLTEDGRYYVSKPDKQFVKNGGPVLFVLTSRQTASAAEAMTDAVRNIENTVVIGTNTGGVLINDSNYGLELPYSGLYLQFGEDFRYWNQEDFQEGYGLEPDLYLTGSNTAERFEKFLARYQQAQ